MYVFDTMLELGLKEYQKWPSKAHREVAKQVLLCNPRITTCEALQFNVGIILKIPKEKIKNVTIRDLFDMGVQVTN